MKNNKAISQGKSLFFKAISVFLIVLMPVGDISLYAQSAVSQTPAKDPALITIPEKFGTVDEIHRGDSGKTIIYIQDAHDSLEAQENIAKIITHLVEKEGVKTVLEEGYEGPVPTDDYFGFIKDPALKEKVSYFLMDKLRIGGAEYAHVNRCKSAEKRGETAEKCSGDFNLIGADSLKLHRENIEWYRRNSQRQKESREDIATLRAEIDKLAAAHFPNELKGWIRLREKFENDELSLLDYLKRSQAAKDNSQEGAFQNISLLLSAAGSKDPVITEKAGRVDAKELFREIHRLEDSIAARWLQNERDKQIYHYQKSLGLLEKLSAVELSASEFEAVKNSLQTMNTQILADFIVRQSRKSVVLSRQWEGNVTNAVKFYESAHQRDLAVKNAVAKNSGETAVLVFGGFHKEGIKEILKQKGFSYIVVTPKIRELSPRHQDYYRQLMSLGHHRFEIPLLPATAAKQEVVYVTPFGRTEIQKIHDALVSTRMSASDGKSWLLEAERILNGAAVSNQPSAASKDKKALAESRKLKAEGLTRSELRAQSPATGVEDFDQSSEDFLKQVVSEIGSADYVLNVPVYNEIDSVAEKFGQTLKGTHDQKIDVRPLLNTLRESAAASLKATQGKKALILVTGESKNEMAKAVIDAIRTHASEFETDAVKIRIYGKEERFGGFPGKKWALRLGMRAAEALNSHFLTVDGDMEVDSNFVSTMLDPVLTGRADYVSPVYVRYYGKDDISIISHFVYPFFSAFYGQAVRLPNEGGFAAAHSMLKIFLASKEELWRNEGPFEALFAAVALSNGKRIEEVWQGEKRHKDNPIDGHFDAYLGVAADNLFRQLAEHPESWTPNAGDAAIRGIEANLWPVDVAQRPAKEIISQGVNFERWRQEAMRLFAGNKEFYKRKFPELIPLGERFSRVGESSPGLTSKEWAQTVIGFFRYYLQADESERARLPIFLKPFFMARVAAFSKEVEGLDYKESEKLLAEQAADFAAEKVKSFSRSELRAPKQKLLGGGDEDPKQIKKIRSGALSAKAFERLARRAQRYDAAQTNVKIQIAAKIRRFLNGSAALPKRGKRLDDQELYAVWNHIKTDVIRDFSRYAESPESFRTKVQNEQIYFLKTSEFEKAARILMPDYQPQIAAFVHFSAPHIVFANSDIVSENRDTAYELLYHEMLEGVKSPAFFYMANWHMFKEGIIQFLTKTAMTYRRYGYVTLDPGYEFMSATVGLLVHRGFEVSDWRRLLLNFDRQASGFPANAGASRELLEQIGKLARERRFVAIAELLAPRSELRSNDSSSKKEKSSQIRLLDLDAIRKSLAEIQEEFPRINAQLNMMREPFTIDILEGLMRGYETVNRMLTEKGGLSSPEQLTALNFRILLADDQYLEYSRFMRATRDKAAGYVDVLWKWYERHLKKKASPEEIASGMYVRILASPQFFIEGNHRTGALVTALILASQGLPVFVINLTNAVAYLNLSTDIKFNKNSSRFKRWLGGRWGDEKDAMERFLKENASFNYLQKEGETESGSDTRSELRTSEEREDDEVVPRPETNVSGTSKQAAAGRVIPRDQERGELRAEDDVKERIKKLPNSILISAYETYRERAEELKKISAEATEKRHSRERAITRLLLHGAPFAAAAVWMLVGNGKWGFLAAVAVLLMPMIIIASRLAKHSGLGAEWQDYFEAASFVEAMAAEIWLRRHKIRETSEGFELKGIDAEKIYENRDAFFSKGVEYFNDEILQNESPEPIRNLSWEKIVTLFEKIRGDDKNPEYLLENIREKRLSVAEKTWVRVWLRQINAGPSNPQEVFKAAAAIYTDFSEGRPHKDGGTRRPQTLRGVPGFDEVLSTVPRGSLSEGLADGHHRLAWFLMNFYLIRNGYPAFYFENDAEFQNVRIQNPFSYSNESRLNYFQELLWERVFEPALSDQPSSVSRESFAESRKPKADSSDTRSELRTRTGPVLRVKAGERIIAGKKAVVIEARKIENGSVELLIEGENLKNGTEIVRLSQGQSKFVGNDFLVVEIIVNKISGSNAELQVKSGKEISIQREKIYEAIQNEEKSRSELRTKQIESIWGENLRITGNFSENQWFEIMGSLSKGSPAQSMMQQLKKLKGDEFDLSEMKFEVTQENPGEGQYVYRSEMDPEGKFVIRIGAQNFYRELRYAVEVSMAGFIAEEYMKKFAPELSRSLQGAEDGTDDYEFQGEDNAVSYRTLAVTVQKAIAVRVLLRYGARYNAQAIAMEQVMKAAEIISESYFTTEDFPDSIRFLVIANMLTVISPFKFQGTGIRHKRLIRKFNELMMIDGYFEYMANENFELLEALQPVIEFRGTIPDRETIRRNYLDPINRSFAARSELRSGLETYERLENFMAKHQLSNRQNRDGTLFVPTPHGFLPSIFGEIRRKTGPLEGKSYLSFGAGTLTDSLAAASLYGMKVTAAEKDPSLSGEAAKILEAAENDGLIQKGALDLRGNTNAFDVSWKDTDIVYFFYTQAGGDEKTRKASRENFETHLNRKILEMKPGSHLAFLFTGTQLMAEQHEYMTLRRLKHDWIQIADAMSGLYLFLFEIPARVEEQNTQAPSLGDAARLSAIESQLARNESGTRGDEARSELRAFHTRMSKHFDPDLWDKKGVEQRKLEKLLGYENSFVTDPDFFLKNGRFIVTLPESMHSWIYENVPGAELSKLSEQLIEVLYNLPTEKQRSVESRHRYFQNLRILIGGGIAVFGYLIVVAQGGRLFGPQFKGAQGLIAMGIGEIFVGLISTIVDLIFREMRSMWSGLSFNRKRRALSLLRTFAARHQPVGSAERSIPDSEKEKIFSNALKEAASIVNRENRRMNGKIDPSELHAYGDILGRLHSLGFENHSSGTKEAGKVLEDVEKFEANILDLGLPTDLSRAVAALELVTGARTDTRSELRSPDEERLMRQLFLEPQDLLRANDESFIATVAERLATNYRWIRAAEKIAVRSSTLLTYKIADTSDPMVLFGEFIAKVLKHPVVEEKIRTERRGFMKVAGMTISNWRQLLTSDATMAHAQRLLSAPAVWDLRTRVGREDLSLFIRSKREYYHQPADKAELSQLAKLPFSELVKKIREDKTPLSVWPDDVLVEDILAWLQESRPDVLGGFYPEAANYSYKIDEETVLTINPDTDIAPGEDYPSLKELLADLIRKTLIKHVHSRILTRDIYEEIASELKSPSNAIRLEVQKLFEPQMSRDLRVYFEDAMAAIAEKAGLSKLSRNLARKMFGPAGEFDEDGYLIWDGEQVYAEDEIYGAIMDIAGDLFELNFKKGPQILESSLKQLMLAVRTGQGALAENILRKANRGIVERATRYKKFKKQDDLRREKAEQEETAKKTKEEPVRKQLEVSKPNPMAPGTPFSEMLRRGQDVTKAIPFSGRALRSELRVIGAVSDQPSAVSERESLAESRKLKAAGTFSRSELRVNIDRDLARLEGLEYRKGLGKVVDFEDLGELLRDKQKKRALAEQLAEVEASAFVTGSTAGWVKTFNEKGAHDLLLFHVGVNQVADGFLEAEIFGETAELNSIATDRRRGPQGRGQFLMDVFFEKILELGVETVTWHAVDGEAERFYRKYLKSRGIDYTKERFKFTARLKQAAEVAGPQPSAVSAEESLGESRKLKAGGSISRSELRAWTGETARREFTREFADRAGDILDFIAGTKDLSRLERYARGVTTIRGRDEKTLHRSVFEITVSGTAYRFYSRSYHSLKLSPERLTLEIEEEAANAQAAFRAGVSPESRIYHRPGTTPILFQKGVDAYPVSFIEDLETAARIGEALGKLHAAGVSHEDLAESDGRLADGNILIESEAGRVYLIDFEHSKRREDPESPHFKAERENLIKALMQLKSRELLRSDFEDAFRQGYWEGRKVAIGHQLSAISEEESLAESRKPKAEGLEVRSELRASTGEAAQREFRQDFGAQAADVLEFITGAADLSKIENYYKGETTLKGRVTKTLQRTFYEVTVNEKTYRFYSRFYVSTETPLARLSEEVEREAALTQEAFKAGVTPEIRVYRRSGAAPQILQKGVNAPALTSIKNVETAARVGAALGRLHGAGILHRDLINPRGGVLRDGNILLEKETGKIHLIDFEFSEKIQDLASSLFESEKVNVHRAIQWMAEDGVRSVEIKEAFEREYEAARKAAVSDQSSAESRTLKADGLNPESELPSTPSEPRTTQVSPSPARSELPSTPSEPRTTQVSPSPARSELRVTAEGVAKRLHEIMKWEGIEPYRKSLQAAVYFLTDPNPNVQMEGIHAISVLRRFDPVLDTEADQLTAVLLTYGDDHPDAAEVPEGIALGVEKIVQQFKSAAGQLELLFKVSAADENGGARSELRTDAEASARKILTERHPIMRNFDATVPEKVREMKSEFKVWVKDNPDLHWNAGKLGEQTDGTINAKVFIPMPDLGMIHVGPSYEWNEKHPNLAAKLKDTVNASFWDHVITWSWAGKQVILVIQETQDSKPFGRFNSSQRASLGAGKKVFYEKIVDWAAARGVIVVAPGPELIKEIYTVLASDNLKHVLKENYTLPFASENWQLVENLPLIPEKLAYKNAVGHQYWVSKKSLAALNLRSELRSSEENETTDNLLPDSELTKKERKKSTKIKKIDRIEKIRDAIALLETDETPDVQTIIEKTGLTRDQIYPIGKDVLEGLGVKLSDPLAAMRGALSDAGSVKTDERIKHLRQAFVHLKRTAPDTLIGPKLLSQTMSELDLEDVKHDALGHWFDEHASDPRVEKLMKAMKRTTLEQRLLRIMKNTPDAELNLLSVRKKLGLSSASWTNWRSRHRDDEGGVGEAIRKLESLATAPKTALDPKPRVPGTPKPEKPVKEETVIKGERPVSVISKPEIAAAKPEKEKAPVALEKREDPATVRERKIPAAKISTAEAEEPVDPQIREGISLFFRTALEKMEQIRNMGFDFKDLRYALEKNKRTKATDMILARRVLVTGFGEARFMDIIGTEAMRGFWSAWKAAETDAGVKRDLMNRLTFLDGRYRGADTRSELRHMSSSEPSLLLEGRTSQEKAQNFFDLIIARSPEGSGLRNAVSAIEIDPQLTQADQIVGYYLDVKGERLKSTYANYLGTQEETDIKFHLAQRGNEIVMFQSAPPIKGASKELLRVYFLFLMERGFERILLPRIDKEPRRFFEDTLRPWWARGVSGKMKTTENNTIIELTHIDVRKLSRSPGAPHEALSMRQALSDEAKTPGVIFVPYEEIKIPGNAQRESAFALAHAMRGTAKKMVIYGAQVSDMRLSDFRDLGVSVTASDLREAYKKFGDKTAGRNVNVSSDAALLKEQAGVISGTVKHFLTRSADEIWAAYLLVDPNDVIPGIAEKDGINSVVGEFLRSELRAYQASLVIKMAA